MSQMTKAGGEKYPHLMGVISQVRLIDEKLTTVDPVPKKPVNGKIRNQTTSTFEFSVPEQAKVDHFRIRVEYSVKLDLDETSDLLCTYESSTLAVFQIQSYGGFDKWTEPPTAVLTPYFAFLHFLVRHRTEERLLSAGFRGVALPVPDNLRVAPTADVKPTAKEKRRPRKSATTAAQ